jgi:long-chain acyl-CoA synthetase
VGQRRVAGALVARGVQAGERVAFSCPSSAGLLVALLGALRSGVVPVPLNPTLLDHERALLLADAEPSLVVDDPAGLLAEVDIAPWPRARPMHYTSGTTGRAKGVWSGLLDETSAAALVDEEQAVWGFAPDDVHLVCSPLWHSAPLRFAAGTLLAGGSVVVPERFDPVAIAEHRPTTAFMVPAHLQRLLAAAEVPPLGSFRLLAHAGAPCPEPLKRAAMAAFPAGAVWEFYGSTEGQFTVCPPEVWEAHPGTVGRARPGRAITADGDGLLWCRAPDHARFVYWRDAGRTAAAWRGDAFTVGDLGRVEPGGLVFLDGRRDDLVISGGVNVYPAEVEQALASFPGVVDVAVFGRADERWGQRVCAAVVGDVDLAALADHARARLAPYKRPKDVYLVAELPRTSTGKVRRNTLAHDLGLG